MPKTKKSRFNKIICFLIRHWPVWFIVSVVLVFARPYWSQGLVPFPSAYLADFFPPWNAYFQHPVKNNAMPDVITQIYPWRKLVIDTFKLGQWPLWNPYSFAGNPHLANFQSAPFQPLNLLFFFLPGIDAWSLMILLQPFLAGIFAYLLARELKISRAGGVVSALAFAFCGFMVVWLAYGTLGSALLWLPLVLYGIERTIRKDFFRGSVWMVFGLAFSFFSGHFQTSLYLALASFLYLFFRRAWKALIPFGLGLLLAAPQLLPSIEFYRLSPRSETFSLSEVIPWQYLVTVIAPDFFGNPVTRNDWFGHYAEWAGFIGVIPLILASLVIFRKQNRAVWFFSLLALFSLLLALPTPLLNLLLKLKIPVLSTSAVSRIISLFSFSMAMLAGFGLDRFQSDWLGKRKSSKIPVLLGAWAILFSGVWAVLIFFKPFEPDWLLVAKRNFVLPTGMLLVFLGLMIGFRFFQPLLQRRKRLSSLAPFLVILSLLSLTAFDLLRFAKKWTPFDPRQFVYPQNPAMEFLKDRAKIDRVFGNLGGEAFVYFQTASLEGYDPLYLRRYGELISAARDGRLRQPSRSVVSLDKNGLYTPQIINLLGVRYLLHTISDEENVWAYPYWRYPDQFELIYQDSYHQIYENKKALPRAFLADRFEVIGQDQSVIDRLFASDFDFSRTVILEENPRLASPIGDDRRPVGGEVNLISYSPNRITIDLQASGAGLLFLSDNYYPGWQGFVDGEKTEIYRADYAFRAVFVPGGKHRVDFVYRPDSFKMGLIMSAVSVSGLGLIGLFKKRFKK